MFVDVAVLLVLLGVAVSPSLFVAAGASVLAVCTVGLDTFLNTACAASGPPAAGALDRPD